MQFNADRDGDEFMLHHAAASLNHIFAANADQRLEPYEGLFMRTVNFSLRFRHEGYAWSRFWGLLESF